MRRAIEHFQEAGVEVDVWKIEGVDTREDAQMLSDQTRKGEGRENVKSVLLGRGASDEKVDHWLQQAAPVEGFIGFAIGRSIWWDALKAFLDGGWTATRRPTRSPTTTCASSRSTTRPRSRRQRLGHAWRRTRPSAPGGSCARASRPAGDARLDRRGGHRRRRPRARPRG